MTRDEQARDGCEAPGCRGKAKYICRGTDAGVKFTCRCCESCSIYLGEDEEDDTYTRELIQ